MKVKHKRHLIGLAIIISGALINKYFIPDSWGYLFGVIAGMVSGVVFEFWTLVDWQNKMTGEIDEMFGRLSEAKDKYDKKIDEMKLLNEEIQQLKVKYKL